MKLYRVIVTEFGEGAVEQKTRVLGTYNDEAMAWRSAYIETDDTLALSCLYRVPKCEWPSGTIGWVTEVAETESCESATEACSEDQPTTASCGGHAFACWGDPPSDHLTAMMIHDLNMRACGANYEKAQPSDRELTRMMLNELDAGMGVIRLVEEP